jgi:hypothetical protein
VLLASSIGKALSPRALVSNLVSIPLPQSFRRLAPPTVIAAEVTLAILLATTSGMVLDVVLTATLLLLFAFLLWTINAVISPAIGCVRASCGRLSSGGFNAIFSAPPLTALRRSIEAPVGHQKGAHWSKSR